MRIFLDGSTDLKNQDESFPILERRIWIFIFFIVLGIAISNIAGCSATKKIAKASTVITQTATESKDRFTVIGSEASASTPNLELIQEHVGEGIKEQDKIISYSSSIQYILPSVEDQEPYWLSVIEYGIIVAGILGVCWLLWITGIGSLIKGLLRFVPKSKQQEADLTVAALDHRSSVNIREVIAAKRASDSEFNVAYERAATKRNSKIRQDDRSSSRIGPMDTRSV